VDSERHRTWRLCRNVGPELLQVRQVEAAVLAVAAEVRVGPVLRAVDVEHSSLARQVTELIPVQQASRVVVCVEQLAIELVVPLRWCWRWRAISLDRAVPTKKRS